MRWSLEHPDKLLNRVIASAMKLTAQNIAFNEIARRANGRSDFCDGNYIAENKTPVHDSALARMIGHITYLSDGPKIWP